MNLFRNESSDPKCNAQRNLCGRTHYVDDDTLRFHKSRVLSARVVDNGLLFAIITSDAVDPDGRKRGFRYVIFNVFGDVLARTKLEEVFRSSDKASKAMWAELNGMDAATLTIEASYLAEKHYVQGMRDLRDTVVKQSAVKQSAVPS